MIRLRRLFLKNISLIFLLSNLFSFNFLDKKISKKNSNFKKKKSNRYTWYLDVNDK